MYLEHVSVVHSVQGDISRIVAPEKPQRWGSWRSLSLSLSRLAEPGRLPRHRLAVIAVDLALFLRCQLRKPHLTGVVPNQCSSAALLTVLGARRDEEVSFRHFMHPDSLFLAMWAFIYQKKQEQIPPLLKNH